MSSSNPWQRAVLVLVFVLGGLSFASPESASAQIRPGIERGDYWGEVRAQYRSEVLGEVGGLMETWLRAWNNDDAESITGTFAEDGVLILGEERSAGQEALLATFAAALPDAGAIEYSLIDFDVRGEMAFATTRFRLSASESASAGSDAGGHLVWVLVKHDDGWLIRSLIFPQWGA